MKLIRLATRGSPLAIYQFEQVKEGIQYFKPDCVVEPVIVNTDGDIKKIAPLGYKGQFVKALEQCLLEGHADAAVHSMKDVPCRLDERFTIGAVLQRGDPRDAWVARDNQPWSALSADAVVGTSSVRRGAQLKAMFPGITVKTIRGNVNTRLRKMNEGYYDGIILAAAGLERLNLADQIQHYIALEQWLPAASQAIMGIECLAMRQDVIELLGLINDTPSMRMAEAEREFCAALDADCNSPVAAFALLAQNSCRLQVSVWNSEGTKQIVDAMDGDIEDTGLIGRKLAQRCLERGAADLLHGE